jgi:catechol 2,3-dioxygenase-like lactoylglutathione lyase family enzyme
MSREVSMRVPLASAAACAIAAYLVTGRAEPAAVVRWQPSLLVQLAVSDLDRSIRFYTETLGFQVTERRDDLQFAHIACGVPGLQLGLSAGGARPPDPGAIVLNFGVQGDIEAARQALQARDIVFDGPTVVIPGKVRLAAFRDPDGYRIRLAGHDVGGTP